VPSIKIKKLYRDTRNGRISGVCAGLADYFGVSAGGIRIAAIIAFLITGLVPTAILYVLLAMVLDPKPRASYY
jgi:phage shock protein C